MLGWMQNGDSLGSRERPNEKRLSCAAVLCRSQTQSYDDGRRQLQPLVRQTGDDTEPSL